MKKILIAIAIILFLVSIQASFADDSQPQATTNNVVLHGIDQNGGNALTTVLNNLFNTTVMKTLNYLYFYTPAELQKFNEQNSGLTQSLSTAKDTAAKTTQDDLLQGITQNLQGFSPALTTVTPSGSKLVPTDETINTSTSGGFSLFTSPQQQKPVTANPADNIFNAASLTAPSSYTTDSVNYQYADTYINSVALLVPTPPIFRIAANQAFLIPMANMQDPTKQYITLPSLNLNQAQSILANVQKAPDYNSYQNAYRSYIAVRSVYLNNLYSLLNERIGTDKQPSAIQLRDQLAKTYQSAQYNLDIQQATPAALARQQVMLLAHISSQLHDIYKQNERIILTNTINGIASLALTGQTLSTQAASVGKTVVEKYCQVVKTPSGSSLLPVDNKDVQNCIKQYSGASEIATPKLAA